MKLIYHGTEFTIVISLNGHDIKLPLINISVLTDQGCSQTPEILCSRQWLMRKLKTWPTCRKWMSMKCSAARRTSISNPFPGTQGLLRKRWVGRVWEPEVEDWSWSVSRGCGRTVVLKTSQQLALAGEDCTRSRQSPSQHQEGRGSW